LLTSLIWERQACPLSQNQEVMGARSMLLCDCDGHCLQQLLRMQMGEEESVVIITASHQMLDDWPVILRRL